MQQELWYVKHADGRIEGPLTLRAVWDRVYADPYAVVSRDKVTFKPAHEELPPDEPVVVARPAPEEPLFESAKSPAPGRTAPPPKLIACPSCKSEVSREAAACPKCGHAFKSAGAFSTNDPVHMLAAIGCGVLLLFFLGPLLLKLFGLF